MLRLRSSLDAKSTDKWGNMSNNRIPPVDSKREEFRKYLERAGVMDSFTKVLICLYEEQEKPADALEYICTHLVAGQAHSSSTDLNDLKEENAQLRERLAQYENGESNSEMPDHSVTISQ